MRLTKIDKLIILFFLLFAVIIFLLFRFFLFNNSDRILIIQTNLTEYANYNLDLLEKDFDLDIKTPNGKVVVHISKNGVYVKETECKDKLCRKNIIKNPGESIVCVPGKILISISSGNNSNVDSVAY